MVQDIKTEHNSVQSNIARGLQVMLCCGVTERAIDENETFVGDRSSVRFEKMFRGVMAFSCTMAVSFADFPIYPLFD